MDILAGLNEAQRQAVASLEGPHMIIAGAGSGKTRVLTHRLAFIIDQGLADPFDLLALTFTNKAAKEMKERIGKLIGPEARNIWMGTFHSIFARILRKHAEKIGYSNSFTIYDSDDSLNLVKKIVKEMSLDDKKFKPKVIFNQISGAKNALVDPIDYATNYATDTFTQVVANVYERYNKRLFNSNAMDFDDLLVKPIDLFNEYPDILYIYSNKFKFIMVDEFQDTNHAQYVITRKLASTHENLCVVGDDAQSIYSFRGATIANILNFKKDYPDTKVFKLEQNYRSTQTIVEAANNIIANNKNQINKNVFTENPEGESIQVLESASEQDESRLVTDQIRELKMRHNYHHKDFAVLYRTNAQSRAVETELRRAGIVYKVFGGLSFYRRKEIKDVVAYLKLAVNPRDEEAISRVINYPTRGIGQTSFQKLTAAAGNEGTSLWEVLNKVNHYGLGTRLNTSVSGFTEMVQSFIHAARTMNAYEAASLIARQSGILKELHSDKSIESLSRWENVQELLNAAKEFSEDTDNDAHTLDAFLAEISLFTDQDKEDGEENDYVTLMTIHSAKGLEFPVVFLVGLEEDLFPNSMSMNSRAELEEERRLFYVAVTRAKDILYLSFAKSRYRYGNIQYNEPSRFLKEINPKFLKFRSTVRRPQTTTSPSAGTGRTPARNLKPLRSINRGAPANKEPFVGDDLSKLSKGMRVEHQKFGEGKVLSLEGDSAERKATVFFNKKGQKVLLLKYAKLKILS